jgi:hypothetical protein
MSATRQTRALRPPPPPHLDEELDAALAALRPRVAPVPPPCGVRVLAVMMQRDEARLLGPWITWHAALFGAPNLLVLDNGSTDPEVAATLERAEASGVMVLRGFTDKAHFEHKGSVFAGLARRLEALLPHDFFMPLDCDEFIAMQEDDGRVRCEPEAVLGCLVPAFRGDPRSLFTRGSLFNIPGQPDRWFFQNEPKVFFAGGMVENLLMGFHRGTSRAAGGETETPIIHFHLRFRPHAEYVAAARLKLEARVEEFSPRGLQANGVAAGSHLAQYAFTTGEEYVRRFQMRRDRLFNSAFGRRLAALGLDFAY